MTGRWSLPQPSLRTYSLPRRGHNTTKPRKAGPAKYELTNGTTQKWKQKKKNGNERLAERKQNVWHTSRKHPQRHTRLRLGRGCRSISSGRRKKFTNASGFGPLLASTIDHDCGLAWLVDDTTAPVFRSSALSCLQKSSSMSSSSQSSFARQTKTRDKYPYIQKINHGTAKHGRKEEMEASNKHEKIVEEGGEDSGGQERAVRRKKKKKIGPPMQNHREAGTLSNERRQSLSTMASHTTPALHRRLGKGIHRREYLLRCFSKTCVFVSILCLAATQLHVLALKTGGG